MLTAAIRQLTAEPLVCRSLTRFRGVPITSNWKAAMIQNVIDKALDGGALSAEEIADLYKVPLFTPEAAAIQAAARRKSARACNGRAEVHAQVGLNVAPCPRNCLFCAFAADSGIFKDSSELPVEEAVRRARQFETDGANAIFIMSTADYRFERFLEVSQEIRRALRPETVLIANTGDLNRRRARQLKDAGYSGIYHAVRMGEGRDTPIPPQKRLETFRYASEAGLKLGTCVEPVGPEHSVEELVEKTLITREANPTYSGAARRILLPGTKLARHGIVSEARMAHILAVVRLALGYDVPGNCTHEPNVIGAAAGANLLWAESGSNPRDTQADTEGQRGMTVAQCRTVLEEAEWQVLNGPSVFYSDNGRNG
jgi:biotin synthase